MPIAIHSAVGRNHELRGRTVLEAFAQAYGAEYALTNPDATAPVDGVLIRAGTIVAVVEVRTRSTYDYAKINAYGDYLVTAQKLHNLVAAGGLLAAPSLLLIELSCGTRLWWRIGNADGTRCLEWAERTTTTRATSLGPETAIRRNAFLPITAAIHWGHRATNTP